MSDEIQNQIPLKSICWSGVVEGPLFKYQSVQNYENKTENTIEINYSFPLPYGKSVITRFSAEINGVVRTARALPKREAEETYEDAMEAGDSPIMLKIEEQDFCTASLGNLKPGEKAKITVEYLQLLEFHGKKARITIPTVLDNRYAADEDEYPEEFAGVDANIFAHYKCSGELLIKKPFDSGVVSSPTHAIKCSCAEEGLKVTLAGQADRDFVVDLEVEKGGFLCTAKDGDDWAAVASFIPNMDTKEQNLDLSILVDCSGSMGGSRIEWAKKALLKISKNFKHEDEVSLFRFGSQLKLERVPDGKVWSDCDPYLLGLFKQSWEKVIDSIAADLGGTELEEALKECTKIFPAQSENSAILLITDGEVWDEKAIIKTARKTGRRIFILGVGMAPYGSLLTKMAETTGGVYESVYSETGIEDAVDSVIARLRSPRMSEVKVRWPKDVIWKTRDVHEAYCADSYTSAAFLKTPPEELTMSFSANGSKHESTVSRLPDDYGEGLVRLVANMRMIRSKDQEEQEFLGVKYNLAGPRTNFLLVVEREEKDKPEDLAKLSIVPQMVVPDRLDIDCIDTLLCSASGARKPIQHARRKASIADHAIVCDKSYMCKDPTAFEPDLFTCEEKQESLSALGPTEKIIRNLERSYPRELTQALWNTLVNVSEKEEELLENGLPSLLIEDTDLEDLCEFLMRMRTFIFEARGEHLAAFNELKKRDQMLDRFADSLDLFCGYMQSHHKDWLLSLEERPSGRSPVKSLAGDSEDKPEELALPSEESSETIRKDARIEDILTSIFFVFYILGYENFLLANKKWELSKIGEQKA